MHWPELVSEKLICTDLQAESRDEAVRVLLGRLVEAGELAEDRLEPVAQAVIGREALGSTAIGMGVALPHVRDDSLDRTVMAIGLSESGLEFNALDGEPVHAIFLVIGSEAAEADEYVMVLAKISKLLHDADFRRFLMRTTDAGEVLELIQEMSV